MEKITDLNGRLLEGCVWDEKKQVLYFVDIECRKIYEFNPNSTMLSEIQLHNYVSCIVPEKEGTLIAGLADGIYRVNFEERKSWKIMDTPLTPGFRYNDGKSDPDGRLWIGSMGIDQQEDTKNEGNFYCIDQEELKIMYSGYTIPNGLCWNKNRGVLYHIDTPTKKVDAYQVADGIHLKNRRKAVDLTEQRGVPDGMCIDAQGKLWIAMWGGSQILCCDPDTGEVLKKVQVPDENVSCCIFGGENLDMLYVTTARDEHGRGGEVYRLQTKTKGVNVDRYGK